jgi:hypothetical protein
MTLKNRIAGLERKLALSEPGEFVELIGDKTFESKMGRPQKPGDVVLRIEFVDPPIWPDDPDFDAGVERAGKDVNTLYLTLDIHLGYCGGEI